MNTTELDLASHLVASRLAGEVATAVGNCVASIHELLAGDPAYTFGLSTWQDATFDDALAALEALGVTLGGEGNGLPYIDPAAAVAGIGRHRAGFAQVAAAQGRVLLATGHTFSLLPHYQRLADALQAAGCTVLRPYDGRGKAFRSPHGEPAEIRYYGGVAALVIHGDLRHTHRSMYMEAMLAEAGGAAGVDMVFADHGFAGAAVEAGIETYSIADVNDPALPLAQWRGRTKGVLVIDDGLNPSVYEPLTGAVLNGRR